MYFINQNLNIFPKRFFLFLSILFAIAIFSSQKAAAREYFYDSIVVNIKINADSTFDVREEQTFNYAGDFHVGWRSIHIDKIDLISDIEVIDGETNQHLTYSSKRLDKLAPSSWGKFTYFKEDGVQNIEWYYNLSDTSYKWILKYKVHGGIGFWKEYDELYWDIFTDYDVPVKKSVVYALLPQSGDDKNIAINAYRQISSRLIIQSFLPDKKTFYFESENFIPREAFTIKVSWPKGLVSQLSYWKDFVKIYWVYILAVLVTLINFIAILVHWYFREKYKKGRGTIVPQYAPPENLRPAMAEVILKEKVTDKGWAATIIDLAVRGYIRIKDDKTDWLNAYGRIILFIIGIASLIFLLGAFFSSERNLDDFIPFIFVFALFFLAFYFISFRYLSKNLKEFFSPKDYILERINLPNEESGVEDYEKKFLRAIFRGKNHFSTKKMRKANSAVLYHMMEAVKETLYKETNLDTNAFEVGVEKEKIGFVILLSFAVFIGFILWVALSGGFSLLFLFASVLLNVITFFIYLKYEARLSRKGYLLKEDWIGFRMYLETAEKYRMQNLTPETFEKYLPYAIIFGVEKKWGKAFESLNIQNPSWYSGGVYSGSGFHSSGSATGAGFSPSAFSSSFSSSFSSAFSSAGGAGGGGGGGGGAGGGGGGGGGGAG